MESNIICMGNNVSVYTTPWTSIINLCLFIVLMIGCCYFFREGSNK